MLSSLRALISARIKKAAVRMLRRVETWSRDDLPRFGNEPRNLRIELPRTLSAPERIFIGDDVWLGPGSLLTAVTRYPCPPLWPAHVPHLFEQTFQPRITIGNRVTATAGLTLAAHQEIGIEDDVLFAANVNITDGLHGFENPDQPYKYQPMFRIAPIVIKRGCWIGQNVVITPGVTIGELSIIGANSVVTRDIPARSIAVGSPARVIKSWDESTRRWVPVSPGT